MTQAQLGDYLPNNFTRTYMRIVGIFENDGEILYHMDDGSVIGEEDFSEYDIRLESEIFGRIE